jgi:hypothetical protein
MTKAKTLPIMWGYTRLRNRFTGQKSRHLAWGMYQLSRVTRDRLCIAAAGGQTSVARTT